MTAASDYLENEVLDHTLGTGALAMPTIYLGLYTSDPTDADVGTEVTGGSYARKTCTFNAAAGGSADNDSIEEFIKATALWGDITHLGIHDASSGGNLLYHGALSATVNIDTDDIFRFAVGSIVVSAD